MHREEILCDDEEFFTSQTKSLGGYVKTQNRKCEKYCEERISGKRQCLLITQK